MGRPWPFRPRPKHALSDPVWRRPVVWTGAGLAAVAALVLILAGGGDGGTDDLPSAATTTAVPFSCIDVANPSLLITIDATAASAVAVDDGWFVAISNRATWYTT